MENEVSYSVIEPYLINGEYVLWRGKPGKGHLLNKSDIYMIPFSLVWCGGVFYAAFTSLRSGLDLESFLFLPFLLVGLYITIGRFFHMVWLRNRTCYVITNLKVACIRNGKVDMLMGNNLPPVSVEIYKDGNGTIRIGQPTSGSMRGTVWYRKVKKEMLTLDNIPDVVRVQQYLMQIASQ